MNTLELIKNYNETIEALNSLRDEIFIKCVRELLNTRTWVWSGGYTPSFNDGDPCHHFNDTHVSNYHSEPAIPDEDEPLYAIDEPVIKLTSDESLLYSFIDDNYEHIYGTDSYRIWKLKDDELTVEDHTYYEY